MEREIVRKLKRDILELEGLVSGSEGSSADSGLGVVAQAFPLGLFPMGVHEFISLSPQNSASTSGFMAALLSKIAGKGAMVMWISGRRSLFPPALGFYGMTPDRVIFVDIRKSTDLLWMIEQALKCHALGAVVGELGDLTFTQSKASAGC